MEPLQGNIEILITGDYCPHLRIEQLCIDNRFDKIYNNLMPVLQHKDISITNLECPLTAKTDPIKKTGPALRANPKTIEGIKYGGFDVVTLANNHILDQNEGGLIDTIDLCQKNGIKTVGAGKNLEAASEPLILTVKNVKIALLNFAENEFCIAEKNRAGANPLNPVANYFQIQKAKSQADIVLVIIHGGHEMYSLPSPRMVETYRFFVDAGAHAVIGHHTHCVSGYEIYKKAPIFYSIGNFIFDWVSGHEDCWYEGYIVKLVFNDKIFEKFVLHPYFQCKGDKPGVYLMNQHDQAELEKKTQDYSKIISDNSLLAENFEKFCETRKLSFLSRILGLNRIQNKLLYKNLFVERIVRKSKIPFMLNLIRCEAHRDVLINTLNKYL